MSNDTNYLETKETSLEMIKTDIIPCHLGWMLTIRVPVPLLEKHCLIHNNPGSTHRFHYQSLWVILKDYCQKKHRTKADKCLKIVEQTLLCESGDIFPHILFPVTFFSLHIQNIQKTQSSTFTNKLCLDPCLYVLHSSINSFIVLSNYRLGNGISERDTATGRTAVKRK